MNPRDIPRLGIAAISLILLAVAFMLNPHSELLIGAIISLATTGTSFWLGSSKGSSDKSEALAAQAETVNQ